MTLHTSVGSVVESVGSVDAVDSAEGSSMEKNDANLFGGLSETLAMISFFAGMDKANWQEFQRRVNAARGDTREMPEFVRSVLDLSPGEDMRVVLNNGHKLFLECKARDAKRGQNGGTVSTIEVLNTVTKESFTAEFSSRNGGVWPEWVSDVKPTEKTERKPSAKRASEPETAPGGVRVIK